MAQSQGPAPAAADANISMALAQRAREAPDRVALHVPAGGERDGRVAYREVSYRELEGQTRAAAAGLRAIGVTRGTRTALMVTPGVEFFVLMYALMRIAAVPVLIDPGIARRALKACLDEAAPEAFIGVPLAHAARVVLGWARRSVRVLVTVAGGRWLWGGRTYAQLLRLGAGATTDGAEGSTSADDLAAILFTSGATGVPKGVEYRHRHFAAQVDLIRTAFAIRPGEVNLPTFPPFALFDPALGLTSVLPAMDFRRPARADPAHLCEIAARFRVDMLFGSPALVQRLAEYGARTGAKLPGLKRVLSAGAPVRPDVVARLQSMLSEDAAIWTPYGATECLPVAVIEGREIVGSARRGTDQGAGICVGRPLAANTVRVIGTRDEAIPEWRDATELGPGEIGEITVAGPSTTERYHGREAATALAKIVESLPTGGARVVHRMGDLGYFDAEGRLWYVGRKVHRVQTAAGVLYPEQVEGVFNTHAGVGRSALVGIGVPGQQRPVLCVELGPGVAAGAWSRIARELAVLGAAHETTRPVLAFLRHPRFPVDIRHNAKIDRTALARWAAGRA
jgi:acyl-CoA synthetase (AMP-forming)/AMP-acid ligase II